MIQINELRIGNLIEEGEIEQIDNSIDEVYYSGDGYYLSNYCCNLSPVLLNEEWLIKAGLIKNNGYPYKFLNGFIKIRNGIYFYKYYHMDIELKYVHQLQNLYFALTATELSFETERNNLT